MQTITPSARAALLASVVETRDGELAIVTRFNGDQIFGLLCTGPLTNSVNSLGEPPNPMHSVGLGGSRAYTHDKEHYDENYPQHARSPFFPRMLRRQLHPRTDQRFTFAWI